MSAAEEKYARPVIEMLDVAVPVFAEPDRVALENVTWTVSAGDYWVVAGLHGTGKSDLLMTTAGLIAPARGVYRFCNQQMPITDETNLETRLRLGLVFDGGRLFNHLSVAENIALPLQYHRALPVQETKAQVELLLRLTQLDQWADAMPTALGRTWQKRVGLARALVLQPDVLVIDNPLAGLDARNVQWWLQFLDELSAGHTFTGGKTVTLVVSTDTLSPWRGHARQVALLDHRQFFALGGWDEIGKTDDLRLKPVLAELGV